MHDGEMTDAEKKIEIGRRIRTTIVKLKGQLVNRCRLAQLDRILLVIQPGFAYKDRGINALTFVPDNHRDRSRTPSKWAVVLHDIYTLLRAYWELIRTDESLYLAKMLRQVEDYAEFGFLQCDLLGTIETGFYLFNKAAQDAAAETELDHGDKPCPGHDL